MIIHRIRAALISATASAAVAIGDAAEREIDACFTALRSVPQRSAEPKRLAYFLRTEPQPLAPVYLADSINRAADVVTRRSLRSSSSTAVVVPVQHNRGSRVEQFTVVCHIIVVTVDFQTTFEDVLVCDLVLMALLTLFLSLSTEHVVFFVRYVSLQFMD